MTIIKDLDYTNGNTLSVDSHNENVYSTTLDHGIMSTANGDLTDLSSSFKCSKEHVWPGEVFRGHQDFQYDTAHYFSNTISDAASEEFVPVVGCALRVYMPYDVTFALWQWSFHLSAFVPQIDQLYDTGEDRVEPLVKMRSTLNGATLEHTVRAAPLSAYLLNEPTNVDRESHHFEHYMARPYDMAHMATSVSAGWHELQVQVFLENFADDFESIAMDDSADGFTRTQLINSRASFGIRNARVLTVL
jgi:hypothetical protein